MFEAKLKQAVVLKHVLDSIRELVTDVNFDCDEDGMKLQAMDNSHVALVALRLGSSGFSPYRCDRRMTLGINIGSFQKIVKCGANDDILTLRAHDDGDLLNIVFETLNTDRVAEYEMKMMDIDIEHLGIPETIYDAEIALPSSEFSRIIRDLKEMGESVRIEATKEGVKFSAAGDIGKGAVMLKHNAGENKGVEIDSKKKKTVIDVDEEEMEEGDDKSDDEEEKDDENEEHTKKKVKKDKVKVKKEVGDDESEKEGSDKEESEKEESDEDEEMNDDDGDGEPKAKKRKVVKKKASKKTTNGKAAQGKKRKAKEDNPEREEEDLSVAISLQQSVSLTFSIKYLSNFTKATPLAKRVTLHMSNEVPLLVAYEFDTGHVRYYLAPKIEDD